MLSTADFITRLENKFRNVPTVDTTVMTNWLDEAVTQHGYATVEDVPDAEGNALIYLAYAVGSEDLWVNSSHYFRYQDGDEMVDKSMIGLQYRNQAEYYRGLYAQTGGQSATGSRKSSFSIPRRVDR